VPAAGGNAAVATAPGIPGIAIPMMWEYKFSEMHLLASERLCYVVQPMYVRRTGITRCRQYLVNASGLYFERPAIHLSGLWDCKTQLADNAPHGLDSGYKDLC
jgi:hypothetical protein